MPSPSSHSAQSVNVTTSISRCQHGLLHKHQNAVITALQSILSTPPSAHQTATVYALTEANTALIKCRDSLMWIYGKKYFIFQKFNFILYFASYIHILFYVLYFIFIN